MKAELGTDIQVSHRAPLAEVLPREESSTTLMWGPPQSSVTLSKLPSLPGSGGRGAVRISLWPSALAFRALDLAQHSRQSSAHVPLQHCWLQSMTRARLAQPAESRNSEPQGAGAGRQ